ncbi:MAG: exodeoxyribonuclease V subunit alpha [Planctomycetota bacterium]|nr:exodeoxyribonuclease V subunit alpha [Planctomycetota bacterium]
MPEPTLGVDLLLTLPGVDADAATASALRLLEAAMANGDTCLRLSENLDQAPVANVAAWRASLLASGLVSEGDGDVPLVLDGDGLASRRYWRYEHFLASELQRRAADCTRLPDLVQDSATCDEIRSLFPHSDAALVAGVDWQRLAACVALSHGLAVVTGGPGTGKTTVAGRVIAIAERRAQRRGSALRVVIAAPTGKAAQRLRESLVATGQGLVASGFINDEQLSRLTAGVATLHRLVHGSGLLGADLVVIDEVSMADAAILARMLERVPASTQVLLLGDPQQLASVDAGHVLGEIARCHSDQVDPAVAAWYQQCAPQAEAVQAAEALHPLAAAQVCLRKNWRSAASPAVSALSAAIQHAPEQVMACLADASLAPAAGAHAQGANAAQAVWIERRDCAGPQAAGELCHVMDAWVQSVVTAPDPAEALARLGRQRILCARRSGDLGVAGINRRIEHSLAARGVIAPWDDEHYPGRPLLVTRNDYDLNLFNGDIGIVHGTRGDAACSFPDSDGSLRAVPLHRLNELEPVFAMSIHKSQGSQFDHIEVMTADSDAAELGQLLTRELIYTAVTRAAYSARIWANADVLQRALGRIKSRQTGLGPLLRPGLKQ